MHRWNVPSSLEVVCLPFKASVQHLCREWEEGPWGAGTFQQCCKGRTCVPSGRQGLHTSVFHDCLQRFFRDLFSCITGTWPIYTFLAITFSFPLMKSFQISVLPKLGCSICVWDWQRCKLQNLWHLEGSCPVFWGHRSRDVEEHFSGAWYAEFSGQNSFSHGGFHSEMKIQNPGEHQQLRQELREVSLKRPSKSSQRKKVELLGWTT